MGSLNIKEVYAVLDELNTYSNNDLSEHLVKLYGITYSRAVGFVAGWVVSNGESADQRITERTEGEKPMAQAGAGKIDHGAHYRFSYKALLTKEDIKKGYVMVKLDPFRICDVYKIKGLGQGTIVKKGLRLGTSIKDQRQDLLDIKNACDRMLEMLDEDEPEISANTNPPYNLAM